MINALSIDVEDYFHVSAFENCVRRDQWHTYPLRVEGNTAKILDLLDSHDVRATFFILGWVAERVPALVREIHSRGHEVASHGYGHKRVHTQTRQEFRDDVRSSKALLEDLVGRAVIGYRAPSYSISATSIWAYDELVDADYRYDSSVFPIRHDLYGIPDWPRFPFVVSRNASGQWSPSGEVSVGNGASGKQRHMVEIPITTLSLAGKSVPIAGGGYFRLFPYRFVRWGLSRINRTEKRPFVFYLHPWELDPDQPRMADAGFKSRLRHYLNLGRTEARFRSLLTDFRFMPLQELAGIGVPVTEGAKDQYHERRKIDQESELPAAGPA